MRLLVVEDEISIAHRIESACSADGLLCHLVATGTEALEMLKFYDYEAVVLDLVLPDINGFEIISRIRAIKNMTPIMILSGLSSIDDKVKCLTLGADDYLTKPFSKVELLARIYAIIRRTAGHSSSVIVIGPLEVDLKRRCVRVNGKEIALTGKEYSILELLALKKGSVLAKETFLNHIYGGMDEPEVKIIDVFICKLRKKIAELTGGLNFIETIWGRGYTLREIDDETANPHREVESFRPTDSLKVG
ncbi:MAG: response regulator transcription factor [Holosporales bacterium]|jgi:two-component system cell cycle response regulator CtrA|nr:response regulator transcription factor [Holosporales bacterium]